MNEYIPLAKPVFRGKEKEYVHDCMETSWISSNGKYINLFEEMFAKFCEVNYAISCSNGTVALHLALLAIGIKSGDEIIVPTLTYIATVNAITYCNATPILIDSEIDTWNMDVTKIESSITKNTKAIIVVHLYGHPVDMDPIMNLARKYGLFVVEDAAEAHGAKYKGKKVGSIGDISIFSFYGNKVITTGEGGMICTKDENLAKSIRQLKGQGQDFTKRYWFPIVGYNYRMTNIEAAIGLGQLEEIEWHISRRREIAFWYKQELSRCSDIIFSPEMPWAENVFWMSSVVLPETELKRDEIMAKMLKNGVETRPFFYPMHIMPPYVKYSREQYPIADYLSRNGINLPSFGSITKKQVKYVVDTLLSSRK